MRQVWEDYEEKNQAEETVKVSGTFYVFRCTRCGQWGVKELRVDLQHGTYNCKYCRKTAKIKLKNQFGLAMQHKGPYSNPREASQVCRIMNDKR